MAVYLKWLGESRRAPDEVWLRGLERRGESVVVYWDVKEKAHDFVDREGAEELRGAWDPPELQDWMLVVEEHDVAYTPASRRTPTSAARPSGAPR